jgi:hypothetical protein
MKVYSHVTYIKSLIKTDLKVPQDDNATENLLSAGDIVAIAS